VVLNDSKIKYEKNIYLKGIKAVRNLPPEFNLQDITIDLCDDFLKKFGGNLNSSISKDLLKSFVAVLLLKKYMLAE
jgi:hypothetical protein